MQQTKPARIVWEKGDFGQVAPYVWPVGPVVVEAAEVQRGDRVLDVACGTGNAALRAAQRGAEVTGLDIVPDLLAQGERLAQQEGLSVTWVEGDAEELPFADGSFDAVLSIFGCMFAPDHQRTADEIARVLAPGGRIALASWIPDGNVGTMFATIAKHMPPPPEGFQPPPLWGVGSHIDELFAGSGVDVAHERRTVEFADESPDRIYDLMTTKFGPLVNARDILDDEAWQALSTDLRAFYDSVMQPTGDGKLGFGNDYLLVTGTKR
jgi:ubiquinone/menaquinone biosynthesis C-methylase UbiE